MPDKKFDPDQQQAVAVRDNAVVAAGAGSGKTTVLAARFLALVREGARVPEILTLTFTRKAAAEMYARIHHLLAAESDNPRIREQLGQFDQASISTLDSFCARLARNDAPRFGLPLSFSVDQESLKKAADELALEFILKHQKNPALRRLIAANGFETVWKDFFSSYGLRELHLTRRGAHSEEFRRQEETCRRRAEENLMRMDGIYRQIAAAAVGTGSTIENAAKAASAWTDPLPLLENEEWDLLIGRAGIKPYRKPGSNVKDPNLLLLREFLEELVPLGEESVSFLSILKERDTYAGLMELMDLYTEEWNRLKQRRGVVSFGDVVAMAVELLSEDQSLRSFYKSQFSHIMIDEFQDNNEKQKELLYLLAEKQDSRSKGIPRPEDLDGEKLFFVGDEKQSIYRFRGADVSVFKRLSRELGEGEIKLSTNYRSDPRLIDFFNGFFPRVMEPESEEICDYEARFEELKGRPWKSLNKEAQIELRLLEEEDETEETVEAIDSEAYEAARLIHEAVQDRSFRIEENEELRRPRYSDFALLLRSTGNQIRYENMFRRFGIPYRTENIRTLFMEAPANDIYAALQLCVYPDDRNAYAIFLRSLFVNLNDETLLQELADDTPPLAGDPDRFPEAEATKYRRGSELIRELSQRIDRIPHREVIRYLWYDWGYRYNLLKDPGYHGYLEYYDYLLALADRSWRTGESMALFLDFLRENLGDYKKLEEVEILKGESEGVRIMTIHKSKGLEFPVVLLGSTGQGSLNSGKRAPYYLDEEYGLTVNLAVESESGNKGKAKYNPFYEQGKAQNELHETAELKRLLYVACTRAEQHLIMLGYRPKRSAGVPSLLDLICRGLGTDPDTLDSPYISRFPSRTAKDLRALGRLKRPRPIAAYRTQAERPLFPALKTAGPLSVSRLNTLAAEELAGREGEIAESRELPALAVDPLIEGREESFGTLVHQALEEHTAGLPPLLDEELEGYSDEDALKLKTAATQMALSFWNSEARRALIPEDIRLISEASFTLALETDGERRIVDGVIDLYADLGDRILCIDFKTNRRICPGAYSMQMWLYRRALTELCRKPVETYLVYLRDNSFRQETKEYSSAEIHHLLTKTDLDFPLGE